MMWKTFYYFSGIFYKLISHPIVLVNRDEFVSKQDLEIKCLDFLTFLGRRYLRLCRLIPS